MYSLLLKIKSYEANSITCAIFTTIYIALVANFSFYENLFQWMKAGNSSTTQIISVILVNFFLMLLLSSLLTANKSYKYILSLVLLISSLTAYFSDSYGVVIDDLMIVNILETNTAEIMGLLSLKMLVYLIFLFFIPTLILFLVGSKIESSLKRIRNHLSVIIISILAVIVLIYSSLDFYSSFIRTKKDIRFYSNPLIPIYSSTKYIKKQLTKNTEEYRNIAQDIYIHKGDEYNKITILIVGETARADHFSVNGYDRLTNPFLSKKRIVSFLNVSSCGTNTGISIPCMFSSLNQNEFTAEKAKNQDNILDILQRGGVSVLWRENNTSSYNVADRVLYEDFRNYPENPICDPECRDIGMLSGLDDYIKKNHGRDILIVLHQIGSHGPEYYKRYPKEFAKYYPICQTNQLSDCTKDEIINSYDNTILYTDFFIDKAIDFLKKYNATHKTSMIYISDHGESLGESNYYLHGLPMFIAPKEQRHVPFIVWLGPKHDKSLMENLESKSKKEINHDVLFHSLLSIFNANTKAYRKESDIFSEN